MNFNDYIIILQPLMSDSIDLLAMDDLVFFVFGLQNLYLIEYYTFINLISFIEISDPSIDFSFLNEIFLLNNYYNYLLSVYSININLESFIFFDILNGVYDDIIMAPNKRILDSLNDAFYFNNGVGFYNYNTTLFIRNSQFLEFIDKNFDFLESNLFSEPAELTKSKLRLFSFSYYFFFNSNFNIELSNLSNFFLYLNFFNVELFVLFSILFILIFNIYCSIIHNNPYLVKNSIYFFILVLFFGIFIVFDQCSSLDFLFCSLFFKNSYIYFLILLLFAIFIIFLFLLLNYYEKHFSFITYEFILFIMFSLFSILLSINCTDLLLIYLILEFQSFCFYIITSIKTKSLFSTEAGLKYFVLSSFSAGIMLFGISLLYGLTGTVNLFYYSEFIAIFATDNYYYLGIILILLGFIFKFGLVPFHMYLPDVYSGTNSFVTLFFLIIQKFFLVILFINLYSNLFIYLPYINILLVLFVLSSILIGSLYALAQFKIKKLIIYSSIVNSGFLLFGFISNNIDGIINSFLFLIIYICTTFLLFIIYLSVRVVHNNQSLVSFYDLLMLKKTHILISLLFTIGLFSIAGIPPLAGFFGKLFLFWSVLKEHFFILGIIAIFLTVVTSYYYIKLIKIMFFDKVARFSFFYTISKSESYFLSIFSLFLIFFFLYPQIIVNYLNYILYSFL